MKECKTIIYNKKQRNSLIGVGERAGSGVPSIIASFLEAAHHSPTYKIHFSPERVLCAIDLNKETQYGVDKTSDK